MRVKKVERRTVLITLEKDLINKIDLHRKKDQVTRTFFIEQCIKFFLSKPDSNIEDKDDE